MARIVSYDHQAAPYENRRTEITPPPTVLDQYVGTYLSPKKQFILHPESETIFFVSDRNLTFEFVKEGAEVSKVVVREHGPLSKKPRPHDGFLVIKNLYEGCGFPRMTRTVSRAISNSSSVGIA
jgi:hypothetical protein